jgi:hypothetical protein
MGKDAWAGTVRISNTSSSLVTKTAESAMVVNAGRRWVLMDRSIGRLVGLMDEVRRMV